MYFTIDYLKRKIRKNGFTLEILPYLLVNRYRSVNFYYVKL